MPLLTWHSYRILPGNHAAFGKGNEGSPRVKTFAGHTYSALWSDALQGAIWNVLTNPTRTVNGPVDASHRSPGTQTQRFYRNTQ